MRKIAWAYLNHMRGMVVLLAFRLSVSRPNLTNTPHDAIWLGKLFKQQKSTIPKYITPLRYLLKKCNNTIIIILQNEVQRMNALCRKLLESTNGFI